MAGDFGRKLGYLFSFVFDYLYACPGWKINLLDEACGDFTVFFAL